jgi:hypothetical protein
VLKVILVVGRQAFFPPWLGITIVARHLADFEFEHFLDHLSDVKHSFPSWEL